MDVGSCLFELGQGSSWTLSPLPNALIAVGCRGVCVLFFCTAAGRCLCGQSMSLWVRAAVLVCRQLVEWPSHCMCMYVPVLFARAAQAASDQVARDKCWLQVVTHNQPGLVREGAALVANPMTAMKHPPGPAAETTDALNGWATSILGTDQAVAACSCDIIQAAYNKRGTHLVRLCACLCLSVPVSVCGLDMWSYQSFVPLKRSSSISVPQSQR